jgi:hypothetical protein
MKINFNGETSKNNSWDGEESLWFDHLQEQFCDDNDLNYKHNVVVSFLWQPEAARAMESWLQERGYRASYYEIPFMTSRATDSRPVCYGLDFDDSCPLFTELRLKYSR